MGCNGVEVGAIKQNNVSVQYFLSTECRQQESRRGTSLVCLTKGLVTEAF